MNAIAKLWPACVSALQLDKLRMGEPVDAEVRAHVAGCAKCAEALRELSAEIALPPLRVVPLRPRRNAWRFAAAAAGVAAAASVLLVLRPSGERPKGAPGPQLEMYVQHEGEVRRAAPGETVAPGDSVRFAVTTRMPYVAVLSLDPLGHASVYFPMSKVGAGRDRALPLATRLDQTVGEERVVGIFCGAPVEIEPLRAALERGALSAPDGCEVTRWGFVKR